MHDIRYPVKIINDVPVSGAGPRDSAGPHASPAARMQEREPVAEGMLEVSVVAGESGPVIMLSGETDLTFNAALSALLAKQLAGGARRLTVDVSGLRFADTAGVRALILAAMTLKDRGGSLVLLRPQESVARVLALTGAEYMFTIRGGTQDGPGSPDGQTGPG